MTRQARTFAHPADARFAFALVTPEPADDSSAPGLVVVVHDSTRNYLQCAEAYAAFAQQHHQVVLAPLFPRDVTAVSESGIFTATDAGRARACGAHAVLVGEALMKASDPAEVIAGFRRA